MSPITITPYGGINEIGGNKFLIKKEKTPKSFFLDFGKNFGVTRKYYEFPFTQPISISELVEIGAIPKIDGLYKDNIGTSSNEKNDVEAVFISHAHIDHIGYVPLLNRNITVFMGECSKRIVQGYASLTYRKTFENDWEGVRVETFRSNKEIDLGYATIKPIHVDHSIPSAYGFLVFIEGKTLAYTGDFRLHGSQYRLTKDFLKALEKEDIHVLLTEGTRVDFSDNMKESVVEVLSMDVIEKAKSMVIVDFNRTDFDRFKTFYRVARNLGREIVVQAKTARMIYEINNCPGIVEKVNLEENVLILDEEKKRPSKGEREILDKKSDRTITIDEVKKEPERYILLYMIHSGQDVRKIAPPSGSIYIMSSSEPVDEEREITFEKILNWMERYGVAIYHIHASGHATPLDIKELVERSSPDTIVPIHTLRPKLLKNFIGGDRKWVEPSLGNPIEIS